MEKLQSRVESMKSLEIVDKTPDPAFAVDAAGRVVSWNRAAEGLIGYRADTVVGKRCDEVVCGRDIFDNRFCDKVCPLKNMVRRGEPVHHFHLKVRDSGGQYRRTSVATVVLPDPENSGYLIVHLLQPAPQAQFDPIVDEGEDPVVVLQELEEPRGPRMRPSLTPRELEILQYLSQSMTTREIAEKLYLSIHTVRNHVQHVLNKLGARSKLEAVILAMRRKLI